MKRQLNYGGRVIDIRKLNKDTLEWDSRIIEVDKNSWGQPQVKVVNYTDAFKSGVVSWMHLGLLRIFRYIWSYMNYAIYNYYQ